MRIYIYLMIVIIIAIIIFLLGLYFTVNRGIRESFENVRLPYRCPNILIQKGSNFFLYNSKLANVPGVNPIQFKTLEDYVEFTKWQRSQGIRCPILYLKESYDTQGNVIYKAHPSPTELLSGYAEEPAGKTKLYDAGRDDKPYNERSYPAYDPDNQYIGMETPLDKMFSDTKSGISPNPMDSNWGGHDYTQSLINEGYYDKRKRIVNNK